MKKENKKDKRPLLLRFVQWFFPKLERIAPPLARRYFIRIFFTPLRYPLPEKERHVLAKATSFTLTLDGKKIQGYEWGQGPMILFVHGWAGRAGQFRKIIERLVEEGHRVVAFDGPAHGNSEGKQTNIMEFNQVLRMIFEQKGTPEVVISHSFGGGAVLFAAMNGLPVKRAVNIASPAVADEIIKTYLRAIGGSWSTGAYFKDYIKKTLGKPFEEFTSLYAIRHLPAPIDLLLVYDEDDKDVGMIHATELMKIYPNASLLRTSGLGHTRILKDEAVIDQIVTFVQKQSS